MIKIKLYSKNFLIKLNSKQNFEDILINENYYIEFKEHDLYLLNLKKEKLLVFRKEKFYSSIFKDSIIIFNYHNNQKIKIFEIIFSEDENKKYIEEFKLKLKKRNENFDFKTPLSYEFHNEENESLLSLNNTNLKGFIRLLLVLMIFNKFKLIVDSLIEFGFIFVDNFNNYFSLKSFEIYFICMLIISIHTIINFYLQKYSFIYKINENILVIYTIISSIFILAIEPYLIKKFDSSMIINFFIASKSFVVFLKAISFNHVMYHVRKNINKIDNKKLKKEEYNNNFINYKNYKIIYEYRKDFSKFLLFKDMIYFMLAPTFCYQLKFKRNKSFRKIWFLKKIFEYLFFSILLIFLLLQWYIPLLKDLASYYLRDDKNYTILLSKFLGLGLPNILCWILFFYLYFQLFLNILSEILLFADRKFYLDWWNCKNLGDYWRLWNLPAHNYFLRHIYFPLKGKKLNKNLISFLIFFISAVGHEYEFSVILKNVYYWAFIGMILQFFVIITELFLLKILKLENSNFGNYSFWFLFCMIGQPITISLYYIDFVTKFK